MEEDKPKLKGNNNFYRCKQCRKVLFHEIIHGDQECTSYFIDAPSWLETEDRDNDTKLLCPKCKVKIGEVVFSGKKCSCQKWVTPGIQIHKVKIDKMKADLSI